MRCGIPFKCMGVSEAWYCCQARCMVYTGSSLRHADVMLKLTVIMTSGRNVVDVAADVVVLIVEDVWLGCMVCSMCVVLVCPLQHRHIVSVQQ